MTPDTLSSLVNLGSAGAVIIVVIIFLKSIRERDAEWRDFFTTLNTTNKEDICKLAETMDRMVKALDEHDRRTDEIKVTIDAINRSLTKRRSTKDDQFSERTDRS